MKKIISILCFLSAFVNAQITQLDQWKTKGNTFTTNTNYLGTNNSRSIIIKTNSTQVGKIDSVGKWTIGTGTVAANTSSLGIVRIKQVSSWIDIGEATNPSIWFNQSTPSTGNYGLQGTSNTTQLNATTHLYNSIGGIVKTYINSSGMRIGSASAPSSTLDVTGNGAFTQSLSINTGSAITIIGSQIGNNTVTAIYCGTATPSSTNYVLNNNGGSSALNGTSNSNLNINSTTIVNAYSSGVAITGVLTTTGASTLTGNTTVGGLTTAGNITTTGSGSLTIAPNYARLGNLYLNTVATNTLVTGNTGTVAVLSDAVFPLSFQADASNPADATTYYMGNTGYQLSATNNGTVTIPYNCTLIKWSYNYVNAGTNASAETGTLQVAGTTTANLTSTQSFSTVYGGGTGTVSVNFNAEDVLNIKVIYPTFATNPTSVWSGMTLWFVRRQ